jgi:hypothetical protein
MRLVRHCLKTAEALLARVLARIVRAADARSPMDQGIRTRCETQPSRSLTLLLGSCIVVATAAYLGANWLRQTALGLPVGLWLVGAVQVQVWLVSRARSDAAHNPRSSINAVARRLSLLTGRIASAAWEATRVVARSLRVPQDVFVSFENRIAARADRIPGSPRPLRIGLDAGPDMRRALIDAPTKLDIEWMVLSPSSDDQASLRQHSLDALFRTSGEGRSASAKIVTREYPEREAAWYDWSTPRPMTYASVFPVRIDLCQVTLAELDVASPAQISLVAASLRAAAALARCPSRLRLSDRLTGRLPSAREDEAVRTPTSLADRAMLELTAELVGMTGQSSVTSAAGRAISAWLASTEAWLDLTLRRQGVEAALVAVGPEPELLLRAAALRIATFDDEAAFQALRDAEHLIRSGAHPTLDEHLAFLQAELELGSPNPLTLGRVAAGICIVCSTSPREKVAFIRGDIMDDVRHSAWMVGRDQDRALLREVFSLMGADQPLAGPWELRDAA